MQHNFHQVFALLLWASAALAFVPGSTALGWSIIAVIFLNAVFAFVQQFQAERAVGALKKLLPARARVLRDGEIRPILARELVPGDVIILDTGDNISADARLIEEVELRTNNAALTGESHPVRRTANPVPKNAAPLIEMPDLVFAGTSVTFGSGRAVVFATGMDTQFGRIAHLTQEVRLPLSPLQIELQKIALIIAGIALVVGTFTPLQILAIDVGTETLPALALGVEPAEPGILERPPRRRTERLLTMSLIVRAYLFFGVIEAPS